MVMKETVVKCPFCGSGNITRQGWQNGKQTYRCKNSGCPKKYFTESYTNKGCDPDVRRQVLVMAAWQWNAGNGKDAWHFPKHCHGSPKGTGKSDLEGELQLCPGAFG